MGKSYKGKTCVYCGDERASQGADHVFAREFFAVGDRRDLPKVPSCDRCNRAKSELEHYLLTVLPFGGQHADATATLTATAPRRLARNAKLHRQLAEGRGQVWVKQDGIIRRSMTIPFEGAQLSALFALITRGLVAHYWDAQIPQNHYVGAGLLSRLGESFIEPFLRGAGQAREARTLGRDVVTYEGVQAFDDPFLTVWRFRLYGGVMLGGDPRVPDQAPAHIWALTAKEGVPGLFDGS